MDTQDKIANLRSFFVHRGRFGVVILIDFLSSPEGSVITLLHNEHAEATDVLGLEFLNQERIEFQWCTERIVIGGGDCGCMPIVWLSKCTYFWDRLSAEARNNFTTACGEITLHYRRQTHRRPPQLSWVDYYGEIIPV